MPLALALVASVLLHAAALVSPAWNLPGTNEPEPGPPIDAVLARPAPRAEPAPAAKPAPKPAAEKPRRVPSMLPAPAGDAAPAVAAAPAAEPAAAPAPAPVAAPPAAVEPAPMPVRIALPAKGRARYTITRGEGGFVVGQAVHTWEHDGLAYSLQSVTETTGLAALFKPARVVQTSRGEVAAEGLRPREFRHERVGGTDTASLDWSRRTVAYAGREEPFGAGAQDMLSMYYQLVLLAPRSGTAELPIATGRKLETYRFEVLGEESVAIGGGERKATRLRTRSGGDSIELWIGAGTRGLPLKIRFTDRKGEVFDQILDAGDVQEDK